MWPARKPSATMWPTEKRRESGIVSKQGSVKAIKYMEAQVRARVSLVYWNMTIKSRVGQE